MRAIGGELELKEFKEKVYFTDSGRSSLRLFLRSANHSEKKYLLPDFFCEVVEKIFKEEGVSYSFYHINEDLTFNTEEINSLKYDVLYVINYFGKYSELLAVNLEQKILLEDNVFFHDFYNYSDADNWYAFNSYRKVEVTADGSLIKTNMSINSNLILNKDSAFVSKKYEAKAIKYSYLHEKIFSENDYLTKFVAGESILDQQHEIYRMSAQSLYLITTQKRTQRVREERFNTLKDSFKEYAIMDESSSYSFFIMHLKNRDDFRKKLMKKNIFLSVHWPLSTQKNSLYSSIISIPLFENYNNKEFNKLIKIMKEVL